MICRRCDRGHLYCAGCRVEARLRVRKRARLRHSQSPEGRADHADRQRAYRKRCLVRVMDLGSTKLAISESVIQPDADGAPMVAIALEDLGPKGKNEEAGTRDDPSERLDTKAEAEAAHSLQAPPRARRVVCVVCGVPGSHVREHFLRRPRRRRGVRVVLGTGLKARIRSG
jgi:hypothetical protein